MALYDCSPLSPTLERWTHYSWAGEEVLVPTRLPLTPTQWGRVGEPHYHHVEVEVETSHMVFVDRGGCVERGIFVSEAKSPALYLLWCHCIRGPKCLSQRGEARNLDSLVGLCWKQWGGATALSVKCGWSRAVVEKFSVLQDCPLPSPLAKESGLLEAPFCL